MKVPTAASILAIGLSLVTPAAAANCRPSKLASSVSSSSISSAPSSSSSPAGPVCTNTVSNGDFALGTANWGTTGSTTFISPCVGAAGCIDASVSSDYTTSFNQVLPTVAGTTYNFQIDFYVNNLDGTNSVECKLTAFESGSLVTTTYTLPLGDAISGGWTPYTDTYTAVASATNFQCILTTNQYAEIYFTDISLQC